jgi:hypothetical protein
MTEFKNEMLYILLIIMTAVSNICFMDKFIQLIVNYK